MLSQSAEYALRAALYMAGQERCAPVRVVEMAEALSIPQNYLSKVLHQLARDGVLQSTRGPKGGFELVGAPNRITLAHITATVEPEQDRLECLLGQSRCSDARPCAAHERWKAVNQSVRTFFAETTLDDLLQPDPALEADSGS